MNVFGISRQKNGGPRCQQECIVLREVPADTPHGSTRDADGTIVVFVPFDERNDAVTVATRYEGEWHHCMGSEEDPKKKKKKDIVCLRKLTSSL